MSTMLEKPKDVKTMSSDEIAQYIEDIARQMGIDLSKIDEKKVEKVLKKISSLSEEIVETRENNNR
jgi:phage-related protein